ncbi:S41 family peptidase [Kouleothrix sp.]|uniref:S41 family peptidase n=1 Tax=Kouleothrix sp. TaxID=2779161 RepID=UPI00391B46F5
MNRTLARCFALAMAVALLTQCAAPALPSVSTSTTVPASTAAGAAVLPSPLPAATQPPSATPAPSPTLAPSPTPPPTPTLAQLSPTATLAPLSADERARIFERLWDLVRQRYLYPNYRGLNWAAIHDEYAPKVAAADDPAAFYALLSQMIDRLGDDHTRFETPQEVAEEAARSTGVLTYGGIGVTIRDDPAGALVTRLAPGGPADMAGVRLRDVIVAIGGVPISDTASFGSAGPEGAVRGDPGTTVVLTVRTRGEAPRDVTVTRQVIPGDAFPPVEAARLPGTRVGVLAIESFDREDLVTLVRDRLDDLLAGGALSGLIVDVRDNGGGYIEVMLETLALFIDGGSIGSSASRRSRSDLAIPGGEVVPGFADLPIVVLINEGTASAAEMFAAGMRVRGRGRLVGATTAGNTENLVLHNFDDGSRLWLAEYAYRLPDGSLIEDVGVRPDREVRAQWWRFEPIDDPQIKAALALLGAAR